MLGLIGTGIQTSRTPPMHEKEAAEQGLACLYQTIDLDVLHLPASALPELITAAERMGFAGLNITHPCKQSVLPLLDELSDDGRALGAVNTVLLKNGKRMGHNTDWWGFAENFRRNMSGANLDHVVQLGAGGAGAATAYAALQLGAKQLTIFDPDASRAAKLAEAEFGAGRICVGEDLAAALERASGLIHATPTGMLHEPGMALDVTLLKPRHWVAEIVYLPLETELLRAAKRIGCRTLDGGGMAVYQAVQAFHLFTGLQPDAERMRRHFLSLGLA